MIKPIRREKISDQVLNQLREMIKEGEFPANGKIPSENQLAKLFNVSRPPIREALSILEASGVIESKQGGGRYVKEINLVNELDYLTFDMIDDNQLFDLLEMRTIIETEAAALAAERATEQELINIKKALDEFNSETKDYAITDYEFHRKIIKATHNNFLLQSIENLSNLNKKFLNYSLSLNEKITGRYDQLIEEHAKIYQAIAERNIEAAEFYMKEHLINARMSLGDPRVLKNNK